MSRSEAVDWLAPVLCAGVFLAFYLPGIPYIGYGNEEGMAGAGAWGMLHAGPDRPELADMGPGVKIMGRLVPLAFGPPHGPGEIYLTAPFVAAFGATPRALRARNAVLAVLGVVLTYWLGLALYDDRWLAGLAAWLLASCPALPALAWAGVALHVSLIAATAGCLWLLALAARRRDERLAFAGCAWLGFGLMTESCLLALACGLAAFGAAFPRKLRAFMPSQRRRRRLFVFGCLACLLAFAVPFLAQNLRDDGAGLDFVSARLLTRADATSNLSLAASLAERLRQMRAILDGSIAYLGFFIRDPGQHRTRGGVGCAAALAASLALLAARLRARKRLRALWLLPWIAGAVYFAVSAFSPTSLYHFHLNALLPLSFLAACSGLRFCEGALRRGFLTGLLGLALLQTWDGCRADRRLVGEIASRGAADPTYSLAALDFCAWAAERADHPLVVMNPVTLRGVLPFCGRRRIDATFVRFLDGWEGEYIFPPYQARLDAWLDDPLKYYVLSLTSPRGRGYQLALAAAAARKRLRILPVKTFRRPNGEPVLEICRAGR